MSTPARCLALLGAALVVALPARLPAQDAQKIVAGKAPKEPKPAKPPGKPAPLFTSDTLVRLTLEGDFRGLFKDRGETHPEHPAVLRWTGAAGKAESAAVTLSTRGHYRLKESSCDVPPIRVRFPEKQGKESLFHDAKSLKLVTHCRRGDPESQQYVLQEHLVYKFYNALTDTSFRARLVRVTYLPTAAKDKEKPDSSYAFFIESGGQVADRLGLSEFPGTGVRNEDADPVFMKLTETFEYFIGNTDWSVPAEHNIALFRTADSAAIIPIPYDWDFSGMVDTRYARVPQMLAKQITSVRDRLYRGFCGPPGPVDQALARYNREKILNLVNGETRLDPKRAKRMVDFIEEFFRTIGDPKLRKRAFQDTCRKE